MTVTSKLLLVFGHRVGTGAEAGRRRRPDWNLMRKRAPGRSLPPLRQAIQPCLTLVSQPAGGAVATAARNDDVRAYCATNSTAFLVDSPQAPQL